MCSCAGTIRSRSGTGRRASRASTDAVVRRFDAPEALDTHFHEIHAKSALNRVPAASQLPFGWTVNPYRGCTHACTYCLRGDTPVLMADGRTRPIADLRVGDEIYGTVRAGRYRRYVRTEVLDHWSTIKPAYRVTLADGTELITSGDHRFLTDRGWKHVDRARRAAAPAAVPDDATTAARAPGASPTPPRETPTTGAATCAG